MKFYIKCFKSSKGNLFSCLVADLGYGEMKIFLRTDQLCELANITPRDLHELREGDVINL